MPSDATVIGTFSKKRPLVISKAALIFEKMYSSGSDSVLIKSISVYSSDRDKIYQNKIADMLS